MTCLIGRWIKLKTSWKIGSKNATFKAFHVTTYICFTFKKVIPVELLWIRLMLVRADDICFVCL